MDPMSVTCDVWRPERSRDESEEQPENIFPMFVTCDASRRERSREVSDEQPENIVRCAVLPYHLAVGLRILPTGQSI